MHQGSQVQFSVKLDPCRTFVGRSAQAATRSEQVEIKIPNPKEERKPSMFASASLTVMRPQSSIFVSKSALVTTERTCVIRVASGHASLIDVQQGDENDGQVQVFGKLKAGDIVLRTGTEDIADQQAVQVALR